METKITIEDDTNCVVLTIEEAKELYEQLGTLFDTKVDRDWKDFWERTPVMKDFDPTGWKDPTTTGPTSGFGKGFGSSTDKLQLQECGKHYMYEICDCAMENK